MKVEFYELNFVPLFCYLYYTFYFSFFFHFCLERSKCFQDIWQYWSLIYALATNYWQYLPISVTLNNLICIHQNNSGAINFLTEYTHMEVNNVISACNASTFEEKNNMAHESILDPYRNVRRSISCHDLLLSCGNYHNYANSGKFCDKSQSWNLFAQVVSRKELLWFYFWYVNRAFDISDTKHALKISFGVKH